MKYTKKSNVQGSWIKASELTSGTRAKLVSETTPQEGEFGTQDIAKIKIQDEGEIKNVRINNPTLNALIEAFGEDSNLWMNKVLTVHTEKMIVAGKRVVALYLIPEGYKISEDAGGYIVISKIDDTPHIEESVEDLPF